MKVRVIHQGGLLMKVRVIHQGEGYHSEWVDPK